MKTSFVLCTKNGGQRLRVCLEHIDRLRAPADMQLVLVDNGSDDGISYEIAQQYAKSSRFDCVVLQTFIPGNSAGRNLALEHADGELILFIDDDCYVNPNMVADWISIFETRDIGFGSGMILRHSEQFSDLGCNESTLEDITRPGDWVRRGLIQGSNMAFRKACLADAGPFDSRFGAGTRYAGEEWDVALRASFAGWSGGYFPLPKVSHDHQRDASTARDRLLFYDFGAGALYARFLFGKHLLDTAKILFSELKALRYDRPRLYKLLAGFFDFSVSGTRTKRQ